MDTLTVQEYLDEFSSKENILTTWAFTQTHQEFISKALTLDPKKLSDVVILGDPSKTLNELTREEIMAHVPLNINHMSLWKLTHECQGDVPSHLRYLNYRSFLEAYKRIPIPTMDLYFTHQWNIYKLPRIKMSNKHNYATGKTAIGYIAEGVFVSLLEFTKENGKWVYSVNEVEPVKDPVGYLKYNHDICFIERIKRSAEPTPDEPVAKKEKFEDSTIQNLPF